MVSEVVFSEAAVVLLVVQLTFPFGKVLIKREGMPWLSTQQFQEKRCMMAGQAVLNATLEYGIAQSRPCGLLVSLSWSLFTQFQRIKLYFQALWASETTATPR